MLSPLLLHLLLKLKWASNRADSCHSLHLNSSFEQTVKTVLKHFYSESSYTPKNRYKKEAKRLNYPNCKAILAQKKIQIYCLVICPVLFQKWEFALRYTNRNRPMWFLVLQLPSLMPIKDNTLILVCWKINLISFSALQIRTVNHWKRSLNMLRKGKKILKRYILKKCGRQIPLKKTEKLKRMGSIWKIEDWTVFGTWPAL